MDRSKYQRPRKTLWNRVVTPKLRRKLRYPWGRLTKDLRKLPGVIVIGTQKGGTSSMSRYLMQHPQFFSAINKEVHFFDYRYDKGLAWYQAMFPLARSLPPGAITGEATPFYMFHPLVPARVAECLPDAKFIVLLRNPVDRALSHYYHAVRRGRETRPIEQAFDEEAALIAGEKARLQRGEIFKPEKYRRFSYTERGLYAEQLERWFVHFPREQFFIRTSESFYAGGNDFMHEVFQFMGIDGSFQVPNLTPSNVGIPRGEDAPMRDRLADYFAQPNRRLEELLGVSYGWSGQTPVDD
jgi:hypothetical protein